MASEVRILGLHELQFALGKMSAEAGKDLRNELRVAAVPVRDAARDLAQSKIRNIGSRWSQMRIGTAGSVVYVAPQARRRGGSPRGNLAPLLMDKAMQPALDKNEAQIIARVELMLDRLGSEAGF